jgi:hypothetical protein
MSGSKELASEACRILHGARGLPPAEAVAVLRPFMEFMRQKNHAGDRLAEVSSIAVSELVRSLEANHEASDDLWQDAIDATLSFANEAGYIHR